MDTNTTNSIKCLVCGKDHIVKPTRKFCCGKEVYNFTEKKIAPNNILPGIKSPKQGMVQFNPDSDLVLNPKNDNLIITVATGAYKEMLDISGPIIRDYAERCNADYFEVTDTTQEHGVLEKWRLASIKGYKRILFIDADVIIEPRCPNMFKEFSPGKVYLHDDFPHLHNQHWLGIEWKRTCIEPQFDFDDSMCMNTAIVLFDKKHIDIWKPAPRPFYPTHCIEQQWVQHQILLNKVPYEILDTKWNTQWWMKDFASMKQGANMIHFASCPNRAQHMRQEITFCPFQEGWKCNLASTLCGKDCLVNPTICLKCESTSNPRSLNQVTASVALPQVEDVNLKETLEGIVSGHPLTPGVGSSMKKLFEFAFIKKKPGCKCQGWEDILNAWGPVQCERNQDKIIEHLQKEANERKIPFSRSLARMLLLGIIRLHKTSP